mmetsp:Transcript_29408/g.59833  ORF Transcript_29408/g.59833 Transcript_29408/m.59833 type:complete len:126 (+) Transcript_29408:349-726(+)
MAGLFLRYHLFLSIGMIFLAIWKAAFENLPAITKAVQSVVTAIVPSATLEQFSTPSLPPDVAIAQGVEEAIRYMPVYAIFGLGMYALSSVLYKVATFEDCKAAAVELNKEIEDAKKKLEAKGFKF